MSNKRQVHVSPGIYTKETELAYAVKSLGITTLGVVGETLKGPAFEPIAIADWSEFMDTFGGTSTEKYKGSKYPKYELPYIAKSYLSESKQLEVVRVLGLSGYNAGPAWVITAPVNVDKDGNILPMDANGAGTKNMPIAVIRSRGEYKEYEKIEVKTEGQDPCECPNYRYDSLKFYVGERMPENCNDEVTWNDKVLCLKPYNPIGYDGNECAGYTVNKEDGTFDVNSTNMGRFKICGLKGNQTSGATAEDSDLSNPDYFEYAVTLNPNDKDYILKVLGTNPNDGDAYVFVESLYDVALAQLIDNGYVNSINATLTAYEPYNVNDYCSHKPINGIMDKPEGGLTRRDLGKRFLADKSCADSDWTAHVYDYETGKPIKKGDEEMVSVVEVGQIYTVVQFTDEDGKRHYWYKAYDKKTIKCYKDKEEITCDEVTKALIGDYLINNGHATLVKNMADGYYYRLETDTDENVTDVANVNCDLNNYKSSFRYSTTPWIVSNIKGDAEKLEMNKMFRFHTISDGKDSLNDIKVSIQNIRPDEGTFDVIVRDINDDDTSIYMVERFTKCNMVPGDSNYIGLKIGTFDGAYESRSKYITVEVNENTATRNSVPAGFLGYPTPMYNGLPIKGERKKEILPPLLKYNQNYDEDIKDKKQYFGLSSLVGVDIDAFTFKGVNAYTEDPEFLTNGFHLDCRADMKTYDDMSGTTVITVDGEKGYKFDAVASSNRTNTLEDTPVIGTEADMSGCIYSNVNLRKFTVYFYGGFDGWDEYRADRTNGDKYKYSQYKGSIDQRSGEGYSFNSIMDPEAIGLDRGTKAITSDYYAYLAGVRQFANPEAVDINILATPGIDYVNNKMLVNEVIDMVEEDRADSIYVVTTPDKPAGATDEKSEMYTPEEVVDNLYNTEITSNYTCTYYPWVKYEDTDNNQYIMLPATKDVVRDMAHTDNVAYPWYAPAGIVRGNVDCVKAHYITKTPDEDELYENGVNVIKTFATEGVKVWGQKTLQKGEGPLTRISVRRLMLRLRRLISVACLHLIFDPNDANMGNTFKSIVDPILKNIKDQRGISDYRISTYETPETRMERRLPVKIFVKAIEALEYIDIDFVITPEGVSFDEV